MFCTWPQWLRRPTQAPHGRPGRSGRPARNAPWLEILERRTVPSFLPPVSYGLADRPTEPVIADFNHDGIPDIAVAVSKGPGAPGYAAIYLGDGQGGFTPAGTFPLGITPDGLRAADLNGDGNLDLVSANFNSANVSVLLGNGDGTFTGPVDFAVGNDPIHVAIGDFNGDGIPDLAVVNQEALIPGDVSVLLGNGDGTFQPAVSYPVGLRPFGHTLVDLNGDGHPDIVTANVVTGSENSVSVLLNNGDGTFAPRVDYSTGEHVPEFPVAGDFNGDGIPDISVTLTTEDAVGVLLGDGSGGLGPLQIYPASKNIAGIAAGDLNNDGYTDLVTTGTKDNTMEVLINDGVWGPAAAPGPGVIGQAVQAVPVNAVDGYAAWPPTGFANGVAAWPPTNFANGVAGNGTVPAVSPIPVHIASADFPALAPPGLDILQDPFA